MDLSRGNDERKKQASKSDIKDAFSGDKIDGKGIKIRSDSKPINHEKDTSEIKLSNKRFI